MNHLSKNIENQVVNRIMQDLEPTSLVVHTKLACATVLGAILSLLICGQFGIAWTPCAKFTYSNVTTVIGAGNCGIGCGLLFSIFPIAILRFILCHPLQFKFITQKYKLSLIIWFLGMGSALSAASSSTPHFVTLLEWSVAAIVGAHIFSFACSKLIPNLNTALQLHSKTK